MVPPPDKQETDMNNEMRDLTTDELDAVSGGLVGTLTVIDTPKGELQIISSTGDNGVFLSTAKWYPK